MNKMIKKILIEKSYLTGKYQLSPEFLSLLITYRCNYKCKSCSIWKKTDFAELSDDEWLKITGNITKSFDKKTFIEVNGGEPLIRKKTVLVLIKELKKYFENVALNSNGLLITKPLIRELESVGLDIMKISFYSLDKNIHNYLRGNAQAYEKALRAIKLLSKSKIKLEVGILITAKNIKELPKIINYLNSFRNINIILQPLDESIESKESKNKTVNKLLIDLWPKNKDIKMFFNWIMKNHSKIKNSLDNIKAIEKYYLNPIDILNYRCFSGQRNCVVYPNGDVSLCFKGQKIGNLKKGDIFKILSGIKAESERKDIKHCQKYCRIIGCNFSRGLKEYFRDQLS